MYIIQERTIVRIPLIVNAGNNEYNKPEEEETYIGAEVGSTVADGVGVKIWPNTTQLSSSILSKDVLP